MHERHARPVREVHVRRRIEHHEVGARTQAEVPDVGAAQGGGTAGGGGVQGLRGVRPISRTASAMHNGIEVV